MGKENLSKTISGPDPEAESWNSNVRVDGVVSLINRGTGIGPWDSFSKVWLHKNSM
jgi:hypothetical protein